MNCLKCQAPMRRQSLKDGFHYDCCDNCGGRWIPGNTINYHLSGWFSSGKSETLEVFNKIKLDTTDIDCPCCSNNKLGLVLVKPSELDVEFCQTCHGIYFDQGEMARCMPVGHFDHVASAKNEIDTWDKIDIASQIIDLNVSFVRAVFRLFD